MSMSPSKHIAEHDDLLISGQLTRPSNARVIAAVQLAGALTIGVILGLEWRAGSIAQIEAIGLLVVALCLSAVGVTTLLRPRTLFVGRLVALSALFIYLQGSLFLALFMHMGAPDQYALNRSAQLMTLLYLASYALLVRRAMLLPVVHSLAIGLQGGIALWTEFDQLSPSGRQVLQLIVATQPLYLALLAWIHMQRSQGIAAQRQAVATRLATLGMISHELRSPLQTIVGAIEALERRFKEWSLPKKEYKNLGRIRFSAAQLDSYLSDLIVMTRQGSGLAEPKMQSLDLQWMLQDMVQSYEAAALDRGNNLEIHVTENCRHVCGDKAHIHQILNNLLSNAIKYTKDGEVLVQVMRVSGDAREWVQFDISDTGVGIAADNIANIWRPYVRLQTGSVGAASGRGLGLAVVRLLVELLGGQIQVSSTVGLGSTFSVRLLLPQQTA